MLKFVLKYGKTLKMRCFFCFFVIFLYNKRIKRQVKVVFMPHVAYLREAMIKADALKVFRGVWAVHTVFYLWLRKSLRLENPKIMTAIWI